MLRGDFWVKKNVTEGFNKQEMEQRH
jgi:hypothetical protein